MSWHEYNPMNRKEWESSYDPKFHTSTKPVEARSVVPDSSTLPSKHWVKPRAPEGSETEKAAWVTDRTSWLKEQQPKHRHCLVMVNGTPTWVYLFKKRQAALLFKLTWG